MEVSSTVIVMASLLIVLGFLVILCKPRGRLGRGGLGDLFGCLVSFYMNRHQLLDWYTDMLAESSTNTVVVERLGARRTIITANPNNVEYMLKTNFKNYPKGKPFTEILDDFLGSGIFNVDGDLWRAQRKLTSHEFSTRSLREYAMNALRNEVEDELLPALESAAESSRPVDLQDLLKRVAFNLICKVSLGTGVEGPCHSSLDLSLPGSPLARAFDVSSEVSAARGAESLPVLWKIKRWLGVGSERRLREAVREIHAIINGAIHEKIIQKAKSGGCELDLLSRMISAGLDEGMMRDMSISFVVAGRDSTSAAMVWLLWTLCCHQGIKQHLLNEIERVLSADGKQLDYETLSELRLLDACLYESMRLYPPVAWDSKHAVADDLLPDGTGVRSGDRVTYFPYGMGRMEALWGKDRLEFRPNRWLIGGSVGLDGSAGELKKVSPFKFPIFQAGPRDCIGKQMAFVQMKYVVASILRKFDIQPVSHSKPIFVPRLTAHMAGGFLVHVRRSS